VIEGRKACEHCAQGKRKCKFPDVEASGVRKGKGRAAEGPKVDDTKAATTSKGKSVLKKIISPLQALGKRKTTQISPPSAKERVAGPSASRVRRMASSKSSLVDPNTAGPSRPLSRNSGTMPPPSVYAETSVSRAASGRSDFEYQLLEQQLRESREDLQLAQTRFASRETFLLDQIRALNPPSEPSASPSKSRSRR
jgi:hypothetical protein